MLERLGNHATNLIPSDYCDEGLQNMISLKRLFFWSPKVCIKVKSFSLDNHNMVYDASKLPSLFKLDACLPCASEKKVNYNASSEQQQWRKFSFELQPAIAQAGLG